MPVMTAEASETALGVKALVRGLAMARTRLSGRMPPVGFGATPALPGYTNGAEAGAAGGSAPSAEVALPAATSAVALQLGAGAFGSRGTTLTGSVMGLRRWYKSRGASWAAAVAGNR